MSIHAIGPPPPARSQDTGSGTLVLPQLNRLNEAFKRRQVAPPASSSSQDQQPPASGPIPSQRRLTQQLTAHWHQFKILRQRYAGTRFAEQCQLHMPQCTKPRSRILLLVWRRMPWRSKLTTPRPASLHWKPLSWLGTLRPTTANDVWDQPLWESFVCTTLGLEVPVLASLPRRNQRAPALCGCKKHGMDLFGDRTSTCTAHSGATKAHDWAVGVPGPLFRTAGHTVRSHQHQVTANGAATWKSRAISRTRQGTAAWSSTCPSHTTGSEAAATCSRKVCYHILRTLTPPCVSLRSAK